MKRDGAGMSQVEEKITKIRDTGSIKQSFRDAGGNLMFSEQQPVDEDLAANKKDAEDGEDEDNEHSLICDLNDENEHGSDDIDLFDDDDVLVEDTQTNCCTRISDKIVEYLMVEPTNKKL